MSNNTNSAAVVMQQTQAIIVDVSNLIHRKEAEASVSEKFPLPRRADGLFDVFNFEVEVYHTYIAGGFRVHNTSVLSFLLDDELDNITSLEDTDGDGKYDYLVMKSDDGLIEVEVTLHNSNGNSVVVRREVTASDGRGNVIYSSYDEDLNGNRVYIQTPTYLEGQFAGQAIGNALTPFLTTAILGDNSDIFARIAADTVLGTILENVGGVIGSLIDIGSRNNGHFALVDQIEFVSSTVFENFGGELVINGTESAIFTINRLIVAELFETISVDGVPGAIFESIASVGLDVLLTNATKGFFSAYLIDVFEDIGLSDASIATLADWTATSIRLDDFGIGKAVDPISIVISAVMHELLPAIETLEGQLASTITATGLTLWGGLSQALGSFSGPVGALIGWFVGQMFDTLFHEDPQAWTKVGFDEVTGHFVVLNTWQSGNGNTQLSKSMAEAYVDGMNGFVDAIMSESNNYNELAQWSFGHYVNHIKNAGKNGQVFQDAQSAYLYAYVTDLAKVQLNDGQMAAVRAIDNMDIEETSISVQKAADFVHYLFMADLVDVISRQSGTINGGFAATTLILPVYQFNENTTIAARMAMLSELYATVAEFLDTEYAYFPAWKPVALAYHEASQYVLTLDTSTGLGDVEAFADANGINLTFYTDEQIYQKVSSVLQIAHDYHTYLENQETIDLLISMDPESAFSAGWYATLALAEEMGLSDPYDLVGDGIDNVFYTGNGNDRVFGMDGNDIIKTYGGDDYITGGSGNDIIFGGSGNDEIYGDDGDDMIDGGPGDDILTGGSGADTFVFSHIFGNDVIKDFNALEGDKVDLSYFDYTNFSSLNFEQLDDGTLLSVEDGGQILFEGVNISALSASQFIL